MIIIHTLINTAIMEIALERIANMRDGELIWLIWV
jgi:hypothetical protein